MSNLAYLATPYSKYQSGLCQAFIDAAVLSARLLRAGVIVYCPIVHTHPIALYGNIDPLDLGAWLPTDEIIMSRCDRLIVAHMEGWSDSAGIAHEVKFFERSGKPIFDLMDVAICDLVQRA